MQHNCPLDMKKAESVGVNHARERMGSALFLPQTEERRTAKSREIYEAVFTAL